MKKFISLICAVAIFFAMTANLTFADDDIKVYLNGEQIKFEDQQPVIIDGRTLVPLRGVFEAMGMSVSWNPGLAFIGSIDKQIMIGINWDGNKIRVHSKVGESDESDIWEDDNNIIIEPDVPAQIINDRTMVPLRVISETVGAEVEWDGDKRQIDISYDKSKIEDNKRYYREKTREETKYYKNYVVKILNFQHYINTEPLLHTNANKNDYYLYDYTNFTGNIDKVIEEYIDDLHTTSGYTLEGPSKTGNENMQVRLVKDDEEIDIVIIRVPSTKKIMIILEFQSGIIPVGNEAFDEIFDVLYHGDDNQNNSSDNTSKETNNTKTESNRTDGEFTYLQNMNYSNLYKDATENYVQSYSQNSVRFELKRWKSKNPGLSKGDECKVSVDYNLDGKYSKITGNMIGSGEEALRVYCDGVLKLTTPQIKNDTVLELDVSGCKKLTLEVFGLVSGSFGARSYLQIREAKLWY